FISCSENKPEIKEEAITAVAEVKPDFYGYESQVKWGEHLVTILGCHDCHTPKKMTEKGPELELSLALSGHSDKMPVPEVNRKEFEGKGYVVTNDFTSWIGPWGISYAANLTPDETGTGNWTEEQFINALRKKIMKGLPGTRPMLPPMAMMPFDNLKDEELKAIFAYLKTVPPIKNMVPQPTPPVLARK
ncbi:MAG: c-type cytochrome, partial [Chitinophagaceae bacterium]